MIRQIVAKRYARALLEVAKENGKCEEYGVEIKKFILFLSQFVDLEIVLNNPAYIFEGRRNLLDVLLAKLGYSSIINNFFCLLMDQGRIGILREISNFYEKLVDEFYGIVRAEVISAMPLKESEIEKINVILNKLVGRKVFLQIKNDPSLIGGVVTQVGDIVRDGSVKTQLASFKAYLQRGDYV